MFSQNSNDRTFFVYTLSHVIFDTESINVLLLFSLISKKINEHERSCYQNGLNFLDKILSFFYFIRFSQVSKPYLN